MGDSALDHSQTQVPHVLFLAHFPETLITILLQKNLIRDCRAGKHRPSKHHTLLPSHTRPHLAAGEARKRGVAGQPCGQALICYIEEGEGRFLWRASSPPPVPLATNDMKAGFCPAQRNHLRPLSEGSLTSQVVDAFNSVQNLWLIHSLLQHGGMFPRSNNLSTKRPFTWSSPHPMYNVKTSCSSIRMIRSRGGRVYLGRPCL